MLFPLQGCAGLFRFCKAPFFRDMFSGAFFPSSLHGDGEKKHHKTRVHPNKSFGWFFPKPHEMLKSTSDRLGRFAENNVS